MEQERPAAPGLRWRKRANGKFVPYWLPEAKDYPVRSVPLQAFMDRPDMLVQRCERLQAEMREWIAGKRGSRPVFDGTFGALIEIYLRDPESTYATLKNPRNYTIYAAKLKHHIGGLLIEECDGRDVQRWFRVWADVEDIRLVHAPGAKLPRARFMLAVLKAANSFGVICKLTPCRTFTTVLHELEFPRPRPRRVAPTADQIIAAREAARAVGAGRRALAYALQFETSLRQWDVIGQRIPMSDPRPSTVLLGNEKWIGPMWEHIDKHMILTVRPTKTEATTEATVTLDLAACPMVMEEIARIPPEERTGPLIVSETTGEPYDHTRFNEPWRRDAARAGLPAKMWNRDLRAGASTEASKAGVSRTDRAKLAGHSEEMQAKVYDRDTVETHRRAMAARTGYRAKNDTRT